MTGRTGVPNIRNQEEIISDIATESRKITDPGQLDRSEQSSVGDRVYFGKRIFDLVAAVLLFVLALPIIVLISVIIRATGYPVIFSHVRVGLDRKHFRCYKFRTMVPDAEDVLHVMLRSDAGALREWRANHKLRNDPRVTPFGRFLRRSSLDELPQLWNVLKGDMSLVGPRPIVEDEIEKYGNKALIYNSVRPGMTGLWQVLGRSNTSYSRRVSMDVLYVRRQSVSLDFWIMFKTAVVVLHRAGAF